MVRKVGNSWEEVVGKVDNSWESVDKEEHKRVIRRSVREKLSCRGGIGKGGQVWVSS